MKNKVVVITGATRGIGKALAELCAKKGAKVVISGRSKSDLDAIQKASGAFAVAGDVTKEADMQALAERAVEKFGAIDIWINNAGAWLPHTPLEKIDMKRAHELVEVNLFGTIYGTRAAHPYLKQDGHKKLLVNIISTSALQGRPMQTIYSASKWAARGFTESLREELKGSNISVVAVYPGGTKTHLFDEAKPAEYDLFLEPEEVASKIIENLEKDTPDPEQTLRRPGQTIK